VRRAPPFKSSSAKGTRRSAHPSRSIPTGAGSAVADDIDRDGRLDLVVTTPGALVVLRGNGDGTFARAGTFATGANVGGVAALDLDGDGRPDLVVADRDANGIAVRMNRTP
jgi:hypothetical protein